MSDRMSDRMQDIMSEIECQIECQKECQIRMLDRIVRVCYKYLALRATTAACAEGPSRLQTYACSGIVYLVVVQK